jgi:hypothetical protein
MMKRRSLYILLLCSLLFGLVLGAGISQSLFVMPAWFASPPASLALIGHQSAKSVAFWIPLQAGLLAALVASLALNWRSPERRKLVGGALGVYVLTWVVSGLFFVPEIISLAAAASDGPYDASLAERGQRWMQLSWGRHVLLAVGWALVGGALVKREVAS